VSSIEKCIQLLGTPTEHLQERKEQQRKERKEQEEQERGENKAANSTCISEGKQQQHQQQQQQQVLEEAKADLSHAQSLVRQQQDRQEEGARFVCRKIVL
jgi:hypothetical protein